MGVIDNKEQRSLDEINSTIEFNDSQRTSQKFLAFLGPGLLVAVGYMDPGNWITSMQGGTIWLYFIICNFNI